MCFYHSIFRTLLDNLCYVTKTYTEIWSIEYPLCMNGKYEYRRKIDYKQRRDYTVIVSIYILFRILFLSDYINEISTR